MDACQFVLPMQLEDLLAQFFDYKQQQRQQTFNFQLDAFIPTANNSKLRKEVELTCLFSSSETVVYCIGMVI